MYLNKKKGKSVIVTSEREPAIYRRFFTVSDPICILHVVLIIMCILYVVLLKRHVLKQKNAEGTLWGSSGGDQSIANAQNCTGFPY